MFPHGNLFPHGNFSFVFWSDSTFSLDSPSDILRYFLSASTGSLYYISICYFLFTFLGRLLNLYFFTYIFMTIHSMQLDCNIFLSKQINKYCMYKGRLNYNVWMKCNLEHEFILILFKQILKADLEKKKQTMDKLSSLSQDLLSTLKNKSVTQKIEAWMENFAQRWDNLFQKLEKSSAQVSETSYHTFKNTMTYKICHSISSYPIFNWIKNLAPLPLLILKSQRKVEEWVLFQWSNLCHRM